jgi:signal transduction histidine kinase
MFTRAVDLFLELFYIRIINLIYMKKESSKEKKIHWQQLLSEFNKSLSLITDIYQLNDNVSAKIRELINVKNVYIFLLNEELNEFLPMKKPELNGNNSTTLLPSDKLIFWLEVNRTHLVCNESNEIFNFLGTQEKELVHNLGIKYIYPLVAMNKVKGVVMLDEKDNQQPLTTHNSDVLRMFLDQAAFAFENALMYRQQKERVRRMYRADRLATLGELAAGAAHEIRNPLTSIRSTIQYLQKKNKEDQDSEMLKDLIDEVDRINEIISGMLSFSKIETPEREKLNLKSTIEQVLKLVTNSARKKGIQLEMLYDTSHEIIIGDQGQLKQVILNILMNSIQSINHYQGIISVQVLCTHENLKPLKKERNAYYIIQITDNGIGIEADQLERIFDPFYTTKSEGTGLGLSISYGIIHKHHGEIEIESIPKESTTVKIKLPI